MMKNQMAGVAKEVQNSAPRNPRAANPATVEKRVLVSVSTIRATSSNYMISIHIVHWVVHD